MSATDNPYQGGVPATGRLRPRGWYPEPRDGGPAARQTRPRYGPAYTNRPAALEPEYPPPRVRIEEAPEFEGVYDRQDGTRFVGVAAGASVTFTFSGVPDSIDILPNGQYSAQLFDQNGIALGPAFEVPNLAVYSTSIAARSITLTNQGPGVTNVAVVGKWLRPRPIVPRYAEAGAPL